MRRPPTVPSFLLFLGRTLRARLLGLVAVAVLPLAVFAVAGVLLLAQAQRRDFERSLDETVQALNTALHNELARSIAVTRTLAASPLLRQGELAAFQVYAREVLAQEPHWVSVSLLTPQGEYLFNSRAPHGVPLSREVVDRELLLEAVRTGAPVVGDLVRGPVTQQPVFTVRAPAMVEGEVRHVVSVSVSPDALRELLQRQAIPPTATVAVLDRNRHIIGRSRDHARWLGKSATPSLQALMRGRLAGAGRPATLEGAPTYAAFRTLPAVGWSVVIGVPLESVLRPQRNAYAALLLGILASLLLGVGGAWAVSAGILRPMDALRRAAARIGSPQPLELPQSSLPEVRELGQALLQADRGVREAAQLREQVLVAEQQARSVAEQSSREKDEFLAMLSHELRNPLAAIGNSLALLRLAPGERETQRAHEIIARQFRHVTHLVNDLLDVSRLARGKINLQCERLDLLASVREAMATMEQAGALRQHQLVVEGEPVPVQGDPHRLHQIANNLVANAAKYSPAGSSIRVTVRRDGTDAVLEVADQGVGMDAQTLDRVFDLFWQASTSFHRAEGGLGIGLTLTRQLVELHGGRITAVSAGPGQGSRFQVRLPALDEAG